MTTLLATVTWQGQVRFSGLADSGHRVAIDGPPEHGGRNTGARPMELLLLGVGGCTAFDVVDILRRGRQDVAGCETRIAAERAADVPRVFERIHFTFRITGRSLDKARVERAIALTRDKYCSASIMLERGGVSISHDYELIEAPARAEPTAPDAAAPDGATPDGAPLRRPPLGGLRHVALHARRFDETVAFYRDVLGLRVEWQPDADNVYLTSGADNLAVHRASGAAGALEGQQLDHIGFVIDDIEDVDRWHDYLAAQGVLAESPPRTHRDGARSFYCKDPEGVTVQMIYHPPISLGGAGGQRG